MGIIPARLTSPTVGLIPTSPLPEEGQTIEPSVSEPTDTAQRFADVAAPEPELDPHGLRSSAYGLCVWPPRPLQPLEACEERKLAHSLKFVFPKITAPASRRRRATPESFAGVKPDSASDPAVVIIRSAVPMLSLIKTGIPWSGPRGPLDFRSASSASAIESASGFSSMIALSAGPRLSTSAIRSKYFSARERAVNFPDFMPSCSSPMVISSSSNGFTSCAGGSPALARANTGSASDTAPIFRLDSRKCRREVPLALQSECFFMRAILQWSDELWWAWVDLNHRPHPYQLSPSHSIWSETICHRVDFPP